MKKKKNIFILIKQMNKFDQSMKRITIKKKKNAKF